MNRTEKCGDHTLKLVVVIIEKWEALLFSYVYFYNILASYRMIPKMF